MNVRPITAASVAAAHRKPIEGITWENPQKRTDRSSSSVEIVTISDEARMMKKLKDKIDETPEIRIPIVEKIRAKIEKNEYPIDLHAQSALDNLLQIL